MFSVSIYFFSSRKVFFCNEETVIVMNCVRIYKGPAFSVGANWEGVSRAPKVWSPMFFRERLHMKWARRYDDRMEIQEHRGRSLKNSTMHPIWQAWQVGNGQKGRKAVTRSFGSEIGQVGGMTLSGPFGTSFGSRKSVFDCLLYLIAMYRITANFTASNKFFYYFTVLQVRSPGSSAVFSAQGLTRLMYS